MATLELNGKSLATQTSSDEPVIASTVTGAPAIALTNATGTMPTGTQDNITRLGTVTAGTYNATIGSSATMPSGSIAKWEQVITTPAATQGTDVSYTDLTGSSKPYTPATGASYVVYEYSTNYMEDNNDIRSIQILKFIYDGTMIDNGNWCIDTEGPTGSQFGLGYIHFKFIIDVSDPLRTGSSTAWPADTAKTLSIKYRAFSSTYNAWWHLASKSLEASDTNVFPEIYQSTYSVM